jgi:hypothetical protein
MKKSLILDYAHLILKDLVKFDDVMIDATLGNGNDTLFLSTLAKEVHAFDIQDQAIEITKTKLDQYNIKNVYLYKDSHEYILNYVKDFKGVIFNLGYLPKGNKEITTKKDITINALNNLILAMKQNQFIQLVIYQGHQEGLLEANAIIEYLKQLNTHLFKIVRIDLPFQDNYPPFILMIYKVKDESN